MQKNWFGIIGRFSLLRCGAMALIFSWLALYPLLAIVLPGVPWLHKLIAFVGWASLVTASVALALWQGRLLFPAFFPQLGMLLVSYMLLRSGWVGMRQGGIHWRDTFYASKALKAHQRVKL